MLLETRESFRILERFCRHPHKDVNKDNLYINVKGVMSISGEVMFDLTGKIHIGNYVMLGDEVKIFTHDHEAKGIVPLLLNNKIVWRDKVINDDVWIFGRSSILMKCEVIAKGVVIGHGSIVTKSITEEYSIWAGNPARQVGTRL